MRRVVGLTSDELATRERVFDGLTMKAVRRSLRALTSDVDALVTAAAAPQLSATPSEPNPTIPAGALGVVTTTWSQEVEETLFPFLVQTFVDAAEDVYAAMPETTGVAPKITYDLAASYLRSASNRLKGIGDLVWADMRAQLVIGYEAGESINQLAGRLRKVAKISEPRALTIARTEVVPAANFGSLQQLKAVGFTDEECRKEWLATEDGRTRPAHLEADGQLVGLSQPFVVDGDFLQVPGDPRGRYENVVNCRCSVAYVFDEDGDENEDEPLVAHGDSHNEKDHGNWARRGDAEFDSSSPFKILPKSRRGKSGDRMYASGMWGRYGGAGLMMRHVGADGVPRYMVVQRSTGGYNKWRWQLPGGARDELETAEQAAARETFEELGFTQEQLDTLEPRGAHVVKLPVEGKEPWTYSSVVADAPAAFKPKIDYNELGAARWLTYEQLVEMRGRGRLIKPFAAQLEDIIAKFDAPIVAGFLVTDVTTSQDHVGYYALMTASKWTAADEAKIKRDSEGKFAKKAGGSLLSQAKAAKTGDVVAVGSEPLHINTAVIYKKGGHKDNEVVAMKPGIAETDGTPQRLMWSEKTKRFLLQGQTESGDWISVDVFTKKAAYDKFSKETGWQKPAKTESVGATPPLKKTMSAPAQSKNINDMTTAEFVSWFAKKFPNTHQGKVDWDLAGSAAQKSIYARAQKAWDADPDGGDPFEQLNNWGYKPDKPAIVVKEMTEVKTPADTTPQPLGKPIHINTTAVYKTKYADGAIVAERELGDDLGTAQQLRWDAKSKKFVLLENVGNGWKTVALYNKGETYQKFSKQTGWTHPVKKPSTSTPIKSDADKGTLSSVAAKVMKAGVTADQIIKALSVDEFKNWITGVSVAELGKYDPDEQQKLKDKVMDMLNGGFMGYPEAIAVADKIDQASLPSIVEIPDFDDDMPDKIVNFYIDLTQDDFDNLSPSDQVIIANEASFYDDMAPDKSFSEKIAEFIAGEGDSDATTGTSTTSPKVTLDWDDNSGPHGMTPIYYEGQVIAYAESISNGGGAQLYDINPVSPSSSYGQAVGTVDFDEGESVPMVIIDLVDTGKLSVPSGTKPQLSFMDNLLFTAKQADVINSVTDAEIDALSPTEYSAAAAAAAWLHQMGELTKDEFDAFNAKGTKTAVPNVTKTSAPAAAPAPATGSKFFVDVHGKIKQSALISTPASPAPPSSMFKVLTSSTAAAVQQTMTSASGKPWTAGQIAAIKKYTTSVGYRSMNAVLRDDPKQLKMFNDTQLTDAVKHAVNLQNAMKPLTDDVKLFRNVGTGTGTFGQNFLTSDIDALKKKFEGQVITDKGFTSTTVLQQTGVSYDYATKPVFMIMKTPAGTPAVHADSAVPGHGESEFILAAGTNFHVDEVRLATADDKAKYGKHVQYVVDTTVVPPSAAPSTPLNTPPTKPASYVTPTTLTPGTPTSPVSATKSGPLKASDLKWPMKITTSVIHTTKYEHGAVVAYRKNSDGSLSRLAWSGTNKKFISQNLKPDGTWETFAGYTKKDAYGTFGQSGYAGSWFSPPPGDSAIGSGGLFGTTSVAPKVSTTAPAPSTVTTAPAPAPVKQQKFDADEIQKLHGQIPSFDSKYRRELFDNFRKNSSFGYIALSTPEASMFSAFKETLDKHNNDPSAIPLNMLQLVRLADEEATARANAIAAKAGEPANKVNEHLYEKKLVAWLQTPSGATYATEIFYPPPPAAFDLSGPVNATKIYKSPNFTPQIIDTLHKIKDPAQIGTPDPDATVFTPIGVAKAKQLQAQMLASNPWTPSQQKALTKYTGSYYATMNPIVRDLTNEVKHVSETLLLTAARTAVNIQEGMRPLPENVKVYRKTQPSQFSAFNLKGNASFADIKKLEGKLFIDRAPMSTSIDPNKWSGTVRFEIDLPKGTPVAYVDDISQNKGELEMLLALGLKYRIISVKQEYGTTKVHMRVEA